MSRNYYLPKDESGRAELLEHLAWHLAAHLGTLDLTDADMAELQADAAAYRYTLATAAAAQAHARQWTAFKTEQYEGKGGALPFPASPAAPEPVTAVPAGIIPRLIRLVARIKAARNYSEDIGRELGIVGTTLSTDADRAKPTPWNTYAKEGLPETPICSPGTDALAAAERPAAGDWLYFVTIDLQGTTLFTRDYNQHLANIELAQHNGVLDSAR